MESEDVRNVNMTGERVLVINPHQVIDILLPG